MFKIIVKVFYDWVNFQDNVKWLFRFSRTTDDKIEEEHVKIYRINRV